MSGGNCPETPRQKMIGMMYLFLTAMLAINVSGTVLDAFETVDKSLQNSNEIFKSNNDELYSKFTLEYNKNKVKYEEAYNKSLEVKERAQALYASIDSAKWDIARAAEGPDGNPYHLKAKDNQDAGNTAMLIGKQPCKGRILKDDVNNYSDFLINEIVGDNKLHKNTANIIEKSLSTDVKTPKSDEHEKKTDSHDAVKTWENMMFSEKPIGAILALLTKLQTDVRNTESIAINHLFSQVTAGDFKVNDIKAHVIPKSTYLVRGSKFSAKLLLAATDSTKRPDYELFVDKTRIQGNEKGEFEYACNSVGKFEVSGKIITQDEDGNPNPLDFESFEFEVVEPFATVSATKMNVLYAGVENPVSISVPGFSARDIDVRLSDGSSLKPNGKGFIAKPKTPGKEINVLVSALIDEKMTQIGKYPFRVKSLPPPNAFIQYPKTVKNANGKSITMKEKFPSGRIRRSDLLKADGIIAELPDSDFEVKYKILGFDITVFDTMGNASTLKSTNSKFTRDQINEIKQMKRGKRFFISNVRALGPDGIPKRLPSIDIELM